MVTTDSPSPAEAEAERRYRATMDSHISSRIGTHCRNAFLAGAAWQRDHNALSLPEPYGYLEIDVDTGIRYVEAPSAKTVAVYSKHQVEVLMNQMDRGTDMIEHPFPAALNEFIESFCADFGADTDTLCDAMEAKIAELRPNALSPGLRRGHYAKDGKVGATLCFEGGTFTIRAQGYLDNGSGYFTFEDDNLDWEQDDESSKQYRVLKVDASELLAIRDHLNEWTAGADALSPIERGEVLEILEGIEFFAWSMVHLQEPAHKNLQGKLDAVKALAARLRAPAPVAPIDEGRVAYNKLVAYFNTPEGYSAFGHKGDYEGWAPADTAIHAMQECIKLRAAAPAPAVGQAVERKALDPTPASAMSTEGIKQELIDLDRKWDALQVALQESGGASGSPGEWIEERSDELNTELKRRSASPAPDPDDEEANIMARRMGCTFTSDPEKLAAFRRALASAPEGKE